MKHIKIEKNDHNQTLIKFLNRYMAKASNSLLYKWIRTKKVKVNKKRAESNTMLVEGDTVDIYIYDEEIEKYQEKKVSVRSKIDLDIAFENDDVMIVDKPQNMLVHAANREDYGKNVVDFIVDLMIERGEYIPRLETTFRPSVVNRIDRNTMGLVIGAKNRNSLLKLNQAIDNSQVKKYYLALVEGKIDKKRIIENRLVKDENNMVEVNEKGKLSKTIVNPIKNNEDYSLVEIELITGRTHQIRATLADIGHPLLGDRRYGRSDRSKFYKDQQLVAYKLEFSENIDLESVKNLTVTSKYKDYIYELYDKLSRR